MKRILSVCAIVFFTLSLITACGLSSLEVNSNINSIKMDSSMIQGTSTSNSQEGNVSNNISNSDVSSIPSVADIEGSSGSKASSKSSKPKPSPAASPTGIQPNLSLPTQTLPQYNVFSTLLPLSSDNKYGSRYLDVVERGDKDGLIAVGNVYTDKLPTGAIDKFDLKLNVVRSVPDMRTVF